MPPEAPAAMASLSDAALESTMGGDELDVSAPDWKDVSALIEVIERREALSHDRRIVSVATNARHLPDMQAEAEHHFHPGNFGGWLLTSADFGEDPLVAVIRFNDNANLGVLADGKEVEVSNG